MLPEYRLPRTLPAKLRYSRHHSRPKSAPAIFRRLGFRGNYVSAIFTVRHISPLWGFRSGVSATSYKKHLPNFALLEITF